MSSKEVSPTKGNSTPTKEEKPLFTLKEEALLKVAMAHCLKSGPPDIDMQKFMTHGEFNTMKTAQNTWGVIKRKLIQVAGEAKAEDGADGEEANGTPKTPKTPKTPALKKRGSAKKAAADDEAAENGEAVVEDGGSPKKKPRKSPVKKGASAKKGAAAAKTGDGDGEAEGEAEIKASIEEVKLEEVGEKDVKMEDGE